jgi:uncharacterized OB-fold protein
VALVPIVEGILRGVPDDPHLVGSRCRACGSHVFPAQDGCPRCTATDMETVLLARRGTLWTWTVQGFAPKAPPYLGDTERFEPFGVGYVELPGQVKVETRLTEADPDQLRIGMEMELVLVPLSRDDDGNDVVTFGFRPVEEERG